MRSGTLYTRNLARLIPFPCRNARSGRSTSVLTNHVTHDKFTISFFSDLREKQSGDGFCFRQQYHIFLRICFPGSLFSAVWSFFDLAMGFIYLEATLTSIQLERSCRLPVKVNSLTSIETELPFSYYNLPFCRPQDGIKDNTKNLGELLMRDGSKKGWTDNPVLDPSLVLCVVDIPHDPYLSENISSWDVEVVLLQKSKAIISSK
ncbi:hypothetical protein ZIOFF_013225 [Zingiber officinale]|uniref:Transmembrane 9 superfamily member n=1 Tax=Zingiber officinale TaxID=94328 RepID=A0A8J5HRE3_ZINOF|nr:hypothetical protein ZIOFF_013225 [Zingiber officinale]